MSMSSRVRTWWRAVRSGRAVDAQIDDELRFHVESRAEDLMRGGVAREEALHRAKAELGSMAAARENARQAWGRGASTICGQICAMPCACCGGVLGLRRLLSARWRSGSERTRP